MEINVGLLNSPTPKTATTSAHSIPKPLQFAPAPNIKPWTMLGTLRKHGGSEPDYEDPQKHLKSVKPQDPTQTEALTAGKP